MATSPIITKEEEYGLRLRLLLEEGANVLLQRLFLEVGVTASTFDAFLQSKKSKLSKIQSSSKSPYTAAQHAVLFPPSGAPVDIAKIDITLTYLFFRNVSPVPGPWGPSSPKKSLPIKIERLRELRNNILHGTLPLTSAEFTTEWNDLESAIVDLGGDPVKMSSMKNCPIDIALVNKLTAAETSRDIAKQRVAKLEAGLKNTYYEVPKIIPNFVGRDGEIKNIRRLFEEEDKEIVVLYGEGGVGKTEITLKFIETHRASPPGNNVIWINAEDRASLTKSFTGFTAEYDLAVGNEPIADIVRKSYSFFSRNATNALFVFDNADDSTFNKEIKKSFFPTVVSLYVKILVTSRLKEWMLSWYDSIEIDTFPKKIAENFIQSELYKKGKSTDNEQVSLLASKLSCLPLALQQCIAYIERHQVSIEKYIQLFESHFEKVFSKSLDKYNKTVTQCCKMTVDALDRNSLKVLYTIVVLDTSNIAKTLINYHPNLTEEEISDAIADINTRCLIKYDGEYIAMHCLTRSALHTILKERSLIEHYVECSLNILTTAIADDNSHTQHYNYGDNWLHHVSTLVKENANYHGPLFIPLIDHLDKIVISFENKERFSAAEVLLKSLRTGLDGGHSLKLEEIEIYIYFTLMKQDKFEEARNCFRLYNNLSDITDVQLDLDKLDYDCICDRAQENQSEYKKMTFLLYCDKHRCSEELDYGSHEVHDWYYRMYVKQDNIREAKLLVKLELCIRIFQCDQGEALVRFESLKDEFDKVFGNEHEKTLQLKLWIAQSRECQEKYDEEAMKEFKYLHKLEHDKLGEDHIDTVDSLFWYSCCLFDLQLYDEAKNGFKKVYDLRAIHLGEGHKGTLNALNWYCHQLHELKQYNEAMKEFKYLHKLQHDKLGEGHNDTLSTLFLYSRCLLSCKLYEEAKNEFEKLYKLRLIHFGENHMETLLSWYWSVVCEYKMCCYRKCEQQFKIIYNAEALHLGADHPNTLSTRFWHAKSLYALHEYEKTKSEFRTVYEKRVQVLGVNDEYTISTLYWYAICLNKLQQYELSKQELDHVYEQRLKDLGTDRDKTVSTLYWMARCDYALGHFIHSKEGFEKVHQKYIKLFGETHEKTIGAKCWFAKSLFHLEEYRPAQQIFESVFEVQKESIGLDDPESVNTQLWVKKCIEKQYPEWDVL